MSSNVFFFITNVLGTFSIVVFNRKRKKEKKRERDDHFISKVIRHLKYEIKRFPKKDFFCH